MWAGLRHPRHVEFYEDLHRDRHGSGEDWQPMIRAVQYLQSQDLAASLFGFTSLFHFQVTTAGSYAQADGHHFVGITWAAREGWFHLSYQRHGGGDTPEDDAAMCSEADFPLAVQGLIQRLLQDSPAAA